MLSKLVVIAGVALMPAAAVASVSNPTPFPSCASPLVVVGATKVGNEHWHWRCVQPAFKFGHGALVCPTKPAKGTLHTTSQKRTPGCNS